MRRGLWGRGVAYPLLGDKVFVRGQLPDSIWEVAWSYSSIEGSRYYRLLPWPPGRTWTEAPDQSMHVVENKIAPLDLLTQIQIELWEDEHKSPELLP